MRLKHSNLIVLVLSFVVITSLFSSITIPPVKGALPSDQSYNWQSPYSLVNYGYYRGLFYMGYFGTPPLYDDHFLFTHVLITNQYEYVNATNRVGFSEQNVFAQQDWGLKVIKDTNGYFNSSITFSWKQRNCTFSGVTSDTYQVQSYLELYSETQTTYGIRVGIAQLYFGSGNRTTKYIFFVTSYDSGYYSYGIEQAKINYVYNVGLNEFNKYNGSIITAYFTYTVQGYLTIKLKNSTTQLIITTIQPAYPLSGFSNLGIGWFGKTEENMFPKSLSFTIYTIRGINLYSQPFYVSEVTSNSHYGSYTSDGENRLTKDATNTYYQIIQRSFKNFTYFQGGEFSLSLQKTTEGSGQVTAYSDIYFYFEDTNTVFLLINVQLLKVGSAQTLYWVVNHRDLPSSSLATDLNTNLAVSSTNIYIPFIDAQIWVDATSQRMTACVWYGFYLQDIANNKITAYNMGFLQFSWVKQINLSTWFSATNSWENGVAQSYVLKFFYRYSITQSIYFIDTYNTYYHEVGLTYKPPNPSGGNIIIEFFAGVWNGLTVIGGTIVNGLLWLGNGIISAITVIGNVVVQVGLVVIEIIKFLTVEFLMIVDWLIVNIPTIVTGIIDFFTTVLLALPNIVSGVINFFQGALSIFGYVVTFLTDPLFSYYVWTVISLALVIFFIRLVQGNNPLGDLYNTGKMIFSVIGFIFSILIKMLQLVVHLFQTIVNII